VSSKDRNLLTEILVLVYRVYLIEGLKSSDWDLDFIQFWAYEDWDCGCLQLSETYTDKYFTIQVNMERVKLIISALQAKRERVKLIISMFSLDGFNFVWLDSQSAKRSRAIKNYSKKDNLQNVKLPLLD